MAKSNSFGALITRHPVVWGGLASIVFYTVIQQGWLDHQLIVRYCASHPIEYIVVTLFFVGVAALAFKSLDVAGQLAGLGQVTLGSESRGTETLEDIPRLQASLASSAAGLANCYLARRLREALQYIQRKGSADTLDEHLRFAADVDLGRMHSSYALIRIIIWAIPILGFLGTVIGITLALAQLGVESDVANSLPKMIAGLYVAFDTTALALALSMVLMFGQFFVDRFETRLLSDVDDRTSADLVGRFQQYGTASDPQLASIRRMSESVVEATRQLVSQQAKIWQASLAEANQGWSRMTEGTGKQIEQALQNSLTASLQQHAASIAQTQQQFTAAVTSQQSELVRQGDVLLKVVDATGAVKQLESTLNDNLSALAGSRNFEETVMSLAAAIQLLTTKLHASQTASSRVDLSLRDAKQNAA